MPPQPTSVCILRLSAIGDTCQVLPVVRAMQAAWPNTRITWVIGEVEHKLLGDIPDIEFLVLRKKAGHAGRKELKAALKKRNFDLLLHLHASMRANIVSRWIKAPIKLGFDKKRARDWQWVFTNKRILALTNQSVIDGFFEFINALGITEYKKNWNIPLPKSAVEFAQKFSTAQQPVVVISPCSSQRFRNWRDWRIENYLTLTQYLVKTFNAKIILTGGKSKIEEEYGQGIMAYDEHGNVINLVGQTNLKELLALLQCADTLICPDSGPAHMASAVNTPVIGLYASSNPLRTGPSHSQKWVINKYPEALKKETDKQVEQVRWGQRVRNPAAMDLIKVDDVITKLQLLAQELGWKKTKV